MSDDDRPTDPIPMPNLSARLTPLELDVLRVCAVSDWLSGAGDQAWAWLWRRRGNVNHAAIRARLYRLGLVDASDRLTLAGKIELWDLDSMNEANILEAAS